MRRNKESRARIKLIQEMHLNKKGQARIDMTVKKATFTYTDLYKYRRGWTDRGMPYKWTARGSATFDGEHRQATITIKPGTHTITPRFDHVV